MHITRKQVISYAVLPGILPRVKALFATGFQYVPYFIALVYGAVRLLPANHPYLDQTNMGRFGVRHVVAEAANNLVVSWKNIDQVILFAAVLVGLIMVLMQILLVGGMLFAGPALAAMPTDFSGFFITPAPAQDVAAIMLDMVFGVPGNGGAASFFESCVPAGNCLNADGNVIQASQAGISWGLEGSFPMAIHEGLHSMFQLYSLGLLVVAAFITIYFIITVVFETMQSGTAFGKRYNKVWAPIRMVVAFGLLIPLGAGLNTSQYLVLYAAKYGSGFATNGWLIFNDVLNTAHGGAYASLVPDQDASATNLVGAPKVPEVAGLLQFMYVARTCYEAERIAYPAKNEIRPYLVKDPSAANPYRYLDQDFAALSYDDIMAFANGASTIKITFGREPGADEYSAWAGRIIPVCGQLVLRLNDMRLAPDQEPGFAAMQRYYIFIIRETWFDGFLATLGSAAAGNWPRNHVLLSGKFGPKDNNAQKIPKADFRGEMDFYTDDLYAALHNPGSTGLNSTATADINTPALQLMQASGRWSVDAALTDKGWAAAALWYNRISEMNGAMTSAVLNIPIPSRYPMVMETVAEEKRKEKGGTKFATRFEPVKASGEAFVGKGKDDQAFAQIYWDAFSHLQDSGAMETPHAQASGNAMKDILNALLGSEGLFSMRENPNVHPLAQLSAVGKSLIEASMRNLTNAAVGGVGGALLRVIDEFSGATTASVSKFLVSFAMISLTAGFILFYIVPFLPFIYFMFAFGGWVKGIFEAMVGAPLWALAHIRIDGNGLSGQAALSGYFLIFEIFLRPILMIFGLLASVSIFSALVWVLNITFDLVVANVGGFDTRAEETGTVTINGVGTATVSRLAEARGVIDEFFYTVIYAIIVYLMGMSSFKLIDLIPNNILRWMGQSITTFNDQRENAAETLTGKATVGSQQATSAIGGGLQSIAGLGGK